MGQEKIPIDQRETEAEYAIRSQKIGERLRTEALNLRLDDLFKHYKTIRDQNLHKFNMHAQKILEDAETQIKLDPKGKIDKETLFAEIERKFSEINLPEVEIKK